MHAKTAAAAAILLLPLLGTAPSWAAEIQTTVRGASQADHAALARQVSTIFERRCAKCHGPADVRQYSEAKGGFDYVLDLERLSTSAKLISPGKPDASKLLSLIERDEMPDGAQIYAEDPVPEDEKAIVRRWITALADREIDRDFITNQQILDAIARDLASLSPPRRETARYLTLTHLYNGGEANDRMEVYRQGVTKLLNSLTWQPRVVKPVPVDEARTVLRVDLADLGWSAGLWRDIAEFNLNEGDLNTAAYNAALADEARVIAYGEATPAPALRPAVRRGLFAKRAPHAAAFIHLKADWFAFVTTRPPLYHNILDLPSTLSAIEKALDVDRRANIAAYRVVRAGVSQSGVSLNNRVIERHDARYGAYWISYDFADNLDDQDIFRYPLGPYGDDAFRHDAGEVIFNLPNGFQAYLLATDEGFRIDKAPVNIVQDASHPIDSTVINGVSCMACHANGMNAARDQVRPYVERANVFSDQERTKIMALYRADRLFQKLLDSDRERFLKALRRAGIDPTLRDPQGNEPISALVRRFERPVDLNLAAAEFGLASGEFSALLRDPQDDDLADLPIRLTQHNLPRNQFLAHFASVRDIVADAAVLTLPDIPQADATAAAPDQPSTEVPAPQTKPSATEAYARGDYAAAFALWHQAAQAGRPLAQYNLGLLYARGEGVAHDPDEAVRWSRRAAEAGVAEAQYLLGTLYNEGRMVPQDFAEALAWFERAAAQGHAGASTRANLLRQVVTPAGPAKAADRPRESDTVSAS